jgi:hypothetical protein
MTLSDKENNELLSSYRTSSSRLTIPSENNSVTVIVNNQIIINGLDMANESLKVYSEFIENIIRFNVNMMKVAWNPFFLPAMRPQLKNEIDESVEQ